MKETEVSKWQALVEAEQVVTSCRAEVNDSESRTELLAEALSGMSAWDRVAAMAFLAVFPDDVPQLLDQLVDLTLSAGTAPDAWEAIKSARSDALFDQLNTVVLGLLPGADADDYLMLANTLVNVEAWGTFAELIAKARSSADPGVLEVAAYFTESHGHRLPTGHSGGRSPDTAPPAQT